MAASKEEKEHAMERTRKIYVRLKECARMKDVCPTSRELAKRFGCSVGAVQNSLHFLEVADMVRKTRSRPMRFFIVADGTETA